MKLWLRSGALAGAVAIWALACGLPATTTHRSGTSASTLTIGGVFEAQSASASPIAETDTNQNQVDPDKANAVADRIRTALQPDAVCRSEQDALGAIQNATQGSSLPDIKAALATVSNEQWCGPVHQAFTWANQAIDLAQNSDTGGGKPPPTVPFPTGDFGPLGAPGGPGYTG